MMSGLEAVDAGPSRRRRGAGHSVTVAASAAGCDAASARKAPEDASGIFDGPASGLTCRHDDSAIRKTSTGSHWHSESPPIPGPVPVDQPPAGPRLSRTGYCKKKRSRVESESLEFPAGIGDSAASAVGPSG